MTTNNELTKIVELLERKYGGVTSLNRDNPLDQLIVLILAAGANQEKAEKALEGLRDRFVDWNEVRVTALHDIDKAVGSLGAKAVEGKAQLIRDILGAIYARFNRVDLDFFMEKVDKQNARRRERLLNYLAERSPALPALMNCYLDDGKAEVQVTGSLSRMLGRLGVFKKGLSPAKLRKEIESTLDEGRRFIFLTGAWEVAESLCHRAQPDCRNCPLNKSCKTAPAEMERARKAEEAERIRIKKETRKLAEKQARETRLAAKKAAMAKKAEEKKKAAVKKKADAEKRKLEAAKKKVTTKKSSAKKTTSKKATTKKSSAKKKVAKKKTTKKTAPKKAAAKKTATKKVTKTAKKKVTAAKASSKKKTTGKKSTAKKTAAKKVATKKTATKKKTTKTATKKVTAKKKTSTSKKSKAKKKTTRR